MLSDDGTVSLIVVGVVLDVHTFYFLNEQYARLPLKLLTHSH